MRRAVLLAFALMACGSRYPLDPGGTFIAFPDDFADFQKWPMFHLYSQPGEGTVHTAGDRYIYLNRRPDPGATEFPVGTMIAKQIPGANQTFAMVKRGGDFNDMGAKNWEWFELVNVTPDTVMFTWRGLGPPTGEGYGGDPLACNVCHAGAKSNDYVQADVLKLENL